MTSAMMLVRLSFVLAGTPKAASEPSAVEVRDIGPNQKGLFATRAIQAGETIFEEAPLWVAREDAFASTDVEDPADAAELEELIQKRRVLEKQHGGYKQKYGNYPREARIVADRLLEIHAVDAFKGMKRKAQRKWMALHDAHRVRPERKEQAAAG